MSGPVLAALDFGTSGVKVALIATDGERIASAQAAYPTEVGPHGEREQDPNQWWEAGVAALAECTGRDRVVALAVTGQMQDLICVDGAGATRQALLYSDTRAGAQHERLAAAFPDWADRTGNLQDSSNVAAKIAWLADHEPDTLRTAHSLLFSAGGYILWRAGADAACDVATASVTGLLDVAARQWFLPLLAAAGVRPDQLPRLVHEPAAVDSVVGRLSDTAAAELGLPAGIPLVLALGDAGATTDGLVGSEPGDAYIYLGSTGWFAQIVDRPTAPGPADAADADPDAGAEPSPLHSLVLPGWQRRLQIGAVLSAGTASAWARATFLPEHNFAEADALAAARLDTAPPARLLCLPGLNGERTPVRDNDARGVFVGVTEQTDALDLYIAVLTGVAMNLRHAATEMAGLAGASGASGSSAASSTPTRLALVGGAAASPTWRRILASVFDLPIVTRPTDDAGIVSAARLAADALGLDHDIRPLFTGTDATLTITEPAPAAAVYRELLPIHRALFDALRPSLAALARL